ncbi:hypothetical protein [Paraburkholderia sp. SOS3]|uniref:hypothetical protein n=1 Tax=Paraburkholderia sp. SOS3 TaxID=1926494 RepID=UPI0018DBF982|nr:hypothetical protein [Paraburkholderia sp. SOS3]
MIWLPVSLTGVAADEEEVMMWSVDPVIAHPEEAWRRTAGGARWRRALALNCGDVDRVNKSPNREHWLMKFAQPAQGALRIE